MLFCFELVLCACISGTLNATPIAIQGSGEYLAEYFTGAASCCSVAMILSAILIHHQFNIITANVYSLTFDSKREIIKDNYVFVRITSHFAATTEKHKQVAIAS